jgi:hypothetical protein
MARTIATTRKGATRSQTRSTRGRTRTSRSSRRRTTRPRLQRGQKELQAFFDHFTNCLTSGDGQGAAACFEYPALMVMANEQKYGKSQPLGDVQVVADFFAKAPQMYHDRGVDQTFADLREVDWLADDLALVRAHFPYIDADGNDMGDGETSLYVVRRNDDGHAICAAITLGTDEDRAAARRRKPRGEVGDHRA